MTTATKFHCPVCDTGSPLFDVVDLNKSCENRSNNFELSGIPIYYSLCPKCGFCFSPHMMSWGLGMFKNYIYNDQYVLVDPEYTAKRPLDNATKLLSIFSKEGIRHLDYGGGTGVLSKKLAEYNWLSISYDPIIDTELQVDSLGKFNFITAYEVFEHIPNINNTMSVLTNLLEPHGIILFGTQLSDGNIRKDQRLSWWYASPRNGHIGLFSKKSLEVLAQKHGVYFRSFSESLHCFYKKIPTWALNFLS